MKPTIGRIVLYALSSQDVTLITARRAANVAVADRITDGWRINAKPEHSTPVELGEVFPAIVVRVDDERVNLKVMLDGADDLWVTARVESDTKFPGTWHWMEYQKQQHAKQAEPLVGAVGTAQLEVVKDQTDPDPIPFVTPIPGTVYEVGIDPGSVTGSAPINDGSSTVSEATEQAPETEETIELADAAGNPLEVAPEQTPEELEKLKEEVGF